MKKTGAQKIKVWKNKDRYSKHPTDEITLMTMASYVYNCMHIHKLIKICPVFLSFLVGGGVSCRDKALWGLMTAARKRPLEHHGGISMKANGEPENVQ